MKQQQPQQKLTLDMLPTPQELDPAGNPYTPSVIHPRPSKGKRILMQEVFEIEENLILNGVMHHMSINN